MILLYSDTTTDARVRTVERVETEAYPSRTYQAEGHYLVIDGPGHIVAYDAQELCKNPVWRMATAQEQNQWAAAKRKAGQLVEVAAPEVPAPAESEPPPEPAASVPNAPVVKSSTLTTASAPKSAAGKDN